MDGIQAVAPQQIALRWFLRMRWVAVLGQASGILLASFGYGLDLPWRWLLGLVVLTSFSNSLLQESVGAVRDPARRLLAVLIADVLILSLLLAFAGGLQNPCASFYLVLLAYGVTTLPLRRILALVAVCVVGAIGVAIWSIPFAGPASVVVDGHLRYEVFLPGWLCSLVLVGACIGGFIYFLNQSLLRSQMALQEAEKQALEGQRLQSLATVAAGVAHELGSPLGTIAIASQDLLKHLAGGDSNEEKVRDVRLIREEVERCRRILHRLDQSSTRQTGEAPGWYTFEDFKEGLGLLLSEEVFARLAMKDETGGQQMKVSFDALGQALVVLIENAADADRAMNEIVLRASLEPGWICFEVLDSGPGMGPETLRRMGEPYFSTKKESSNLGLGLFLVKTLMLKLGGECLHLTRPNGGTRAVLRFPKEEGDLPQR
ncbi:ATP-binding protein [Verrucomicrobiaceae bacterium 227]